MRWIQGLAVAAVITWQSAGAATPEEIFEKASPSIVVLEVQDWQGRLAGAGSGVIIGQLDTGGPTTQVGELAKIATNCHVAKAGPVLFVHHLGQRYEAKLEESDPERDVCVVVAPRLNFASNLSFALDGMYRTGARVYAIGAPEGLELTISEGLISGLRKLPDGSTVIQTSAPISPGSSGGGLFDTDGRLVGITTAFLPGGQNLNFAIPLEWIIEMPRRARKARQQQYASGYGTAAPQPVPAPAAPKARAPAATNSLSATLLREACETEDVSTCLSYLYGFIDGMRTQATVSGSTPHACPPPMVTMPALARAFNRWYDRQPVGDKGLAATALATALMDAYPCGASTL